MRRTIRKQMNAAAAGADERLAVRQLELLDAEHAARRAKMRAKRIARARKQATAARAGARLSRGAPPLHLGATTRPTEQQLPPLPRVVSVPTLPPALASSYPLPLPPTPPPHFPEQVASIEGKMMQKTKRKMG